ncbi:MAG: DinB family protein [Flavobacteriales bacterium]|nr:DinB family protein [Flavobacteriales bacterium]
MNKQTLKNNLSERHNSFISNMHNLTDEEFVSCKNEKWSAGQQLEHIYLSVKPVRQILGLPRFTLKLIWGKANRESKSYDELVKKYIYKLEKGGRATGRFIPKVVSIEKRDKLNVELKNEINKLNSILDKFTEEELDYYILPHPLLGKLTLREIMYFTIYHVEHHEALTKRNLIL